MQDIFRHLEERQGQALETLIRLCRQPSLSATGEGLAATADLVASLLQEAGFQTSLLPTQGGPPVVYGELAGRSPYTLLLYNHYDVQPPEPLALWTAPPFEPTLREDCLFARGAADNKGNIAARLATVRAFREVRGELPISVKFLIEGEEEVGSPHLAAFLRQRRELLRADACLWEGSGVDWDGRPVIILGVKGIVYVELEARGAARDSHSSWATVVPNPAWRLVWALATLKGQDERVAIPGFYDEVEPPHAADLAAADLIPAQEEEQKRSLGLKGFLLDLAGPPLQRRHLFEPTCTICGLASGYAGEGVKTVLPAAARAKLEFRLVPRQRPEDILEKLRHHLARRGFGDISVKPLDMGELPAHTSLEEPIIGVVAEAAREVYGAEPVIYPTMAATGPMHPFVHELGIPTASTGVEHPDSRPHAPDENIRLRDFLLGAKHLAAIIGRLSPRRP
ncbi:MAG: M20/M25/M40 family metallo-hydrolase [Chloroflexi bacterium]|nr:M20/M25/M40 family metallo-hydrolase [Chloroflexota bacterium]